MFPPTGNDLARVFCIDDHTMLPAIDEDYIAQKKQGCLL